MTDKYFQSSMYVQDFLPFETYFWYLEYLAFYHISSITKKQAGAELGQAQLKLGLGFTSTNLL